MKECALFLDFMPPFDLANIFIFLFIIADVMMQVPVRFLLARQFFAEGSLKGEEALERSVSAESPLLF